MPPTYMIEYQHLQGWKMKMCKHDNMEQTEHVCLAAKRLHPAGMFFNFIKSVKDLILGFGIGAIAILKQSPFYALIFIVLFILFLIFSSILSWLRYTYRVEEGELRIEQGIFIRKKRYVSTNRIHRIDFTANVIHRMFNLVEVKVDTASSESGEVALSAVKIEYAKKLREALKIEKIQRKQVEQAQAVINNPVQKISWKRLFITGSTSGSAGLIIAASFVFLEQIQQFIPEDFFAQAFHWVAYLGMVIFIISVVIGFVFLWFIGIAGTMIKYGNF